MLSYLTTKDSYMLRYTVDSWMYRAVNEQHLAVGRSLSLDQPSGIRLQASSEMRLRTLFDSH